MSLKEQLMADIKSAMKSKESERLATLRFVHAAIKDCEINMRPKEASEEDYVGVLKKMAKQRNDSIEQFENASRQDLADKEKSELTIIENYLPEPLSEEVVEACVLESIKEAGAESMKDMGKVMKLVKEKTNGAADNKLVSSIVKSKLQ